MAKFTIEINLDGSAFDHLPAGQITCMCQQAASRFGDVVTNRDDMDHIKEYSGKLLDDNGNTYGEWRFENRD